MGFLGDPLKLMTDIIATTNIEAHDDDFNKYVDEISLIAEKINGIEVVDPKARNKEFKFSLISEDYGNFMALRTTGEISELSRNKMLDYFSDITNDENGNLKRSVVSNSGRDPPGGSMWNFFKKRLLSVDYENNDKYRTLLENVKKFFKKKKREENNFKKKITEEIIEKEVNGRPKKVNITVDEKIKEIATISHFKLGLVWNFKPVGGFLISNFLKFKDEDRFKDGTMLMYCNNEYSMKCTENSVVVADSSNLNEIKNESSKHVFYISENTLRPASNILYGSFRIVNPNNGEITTINDDHGTENKKNTLLNILNRIEYDMKDSKNTLFIGSDRIRKKSGEKRKPESTQIVNNPTAPKKKRAQNHMSENYEKKILFNIQKFSIFESDLSHISRKSTTMDAKILKAFCMRRGLSTSSKYMNALLFKHNIPIKKKVMETKYFKVGTMSKSFAKNNLLFGGGDIVLFFKKQPNNEILQQVKNCGILTACDILVFDQGPFLPVMKLPDLKLIVVHDYEKTIGLKKSDSKVENIILFGKNKNNFFDVKTYKTNNVITDNVFTDNVATDSSVTVHKLDKGNIKNFFIEENITSHEIGKIEMENPSWLKSNRSKNELLVDTILNIKRNHAQQYIDTNIFDRNQYGVTNIQQYGNYDNTSLIGDTGQEGYDLLSTSNNAPLTPLEPHNIENDVIDSDHDGYLNEAAFHDSR